MDAGTNRLTENLEIAGLGDKRQVTITIACTLSGTLLPLQILYAGKTSRCHPRSPFPEDFDAWHTPNHWATLETTIRLFDKIIIPYIARKRRELELPEEHMALVILDVFRGHTTPEVQDLLLKNNIITVFVPSNCTDLLQPIDLSVNKPFKDHLRAKFQSWYSEKVATQLEAGRTQKKY